jgi:hypothetical protein
VGFLNRGLAPRADPNLPLAPTENARGADYPHNAGPACDSLNHGPDQEDYEMSQDSKLDYEAPSVEQVDTVDAPAVTAAADTSDALPGR